MLEGPKEAAQMASTSIKFDAKSPAAEKLRHAVFAKIKELWCGARLQPEHTLTSAALRGSG